MHELMFHALQGMSERSELIPCNDNNWGEPERAPHKRDGCSQSIMVRMSPARHYMHCTQCAIYSRGRVNIFRRPHEETSALSGTMCFYLYFIY